LFLKRNVKRTFTILPLHMPHMFGQCALGHGSSDIVHRHFLGSLEKSF